MRRIPKNHGTFWRPHKTRKDARPSRACHYPPPHGSRVNLAPACIISTQTHFRTRSGIFTGVQPIRENEVLRWERHFSRFVFIFIWSLLRGRKFEFNCGSYRLDPDFKEMPWEENLVFSRSPGSWVLKELRLSVFEICVWLFGIDFRIMCVGFGIIVMRVYMKIVILWWNILLFHSEFQFSKTCFEL